LQETSGQWRIFFFITGAIYIFGALFFVIFGSGEEQAWAKVPGGGYAPLEQERTVTVQAVQEGNYDSDEPPPLTKGSGPPPAYSP
jgi:ACS family sodium-dependent inorganic phosphate cotransporter-like MFS transporter 5